jgi:hypothetical protein
MEAVTSGKVTANHAEPTIESAAERFRTLAQEAISKSTKDMLPRQVVMFVGPVPNTVTESMPRKPSKSSASLGLDQIAMTGVVDRALRLLHHPAIKKITFQTETGSSLIEVKDVKGHTFEISVRRK